MKKRSYVLTEWHGVVEKIIKDWGQDDYRKLEEFMSTGNSFMLFEPIMEFKKLARAAQAYLDFDRNHSYTTEIP